MTPRPCLSLLPLLLAAPALAQEASSEGAVSAPEAARPGATPRLSMGVVTALGTEADYQIPWVTPGLELRLKMTPTLTLVGGAQIPLDPTQTYTDFAWPIGYVRAAHTYTLAQHGGPETYLSLEAGLAFEYGVGPSVGVFLGHELEAEDAIMTLLFGGHVTSALCFNEEDCGGLRTGSWVWASGQAGLLFNF